METLIETVKTTLTNNHKMIAELESKKEDMAMLKEKVEQNSKEYEKLTDEYDKIACEYDILYEKYNVFKTDCENRILDAIFNPKNDDGTPFSVEDDDITDLFRKVIGD